MRMLIFKYDDYIVRADYFGGHSNVLVLLCLLGILLKIGLIHILELEFLKPIQETNFMELLGSH